MAITIVKDANVVSLSKSLPKTTHNEAEKFSRLTIKERLTLLNGAFPMDEAVIEGLSSTSAYC
jgi:hypothetical protein